MPPSLQRSAVHRAGTMPPSPGQQRPYGQDSVPMNIRRIGLVVALAWAALGCGDDAGASDADALDFSEFDRILTDYAAADDVEGLSAVVVHRERGVVHEAGYGAFEADRLYLIASSSKVLSAGVIMRLQDEGLLDVDEPIGTYVGDAFGEGHAELTLAQMLSNSSGLVGLVDDPTYAPYVCQYLPGGTLTECAEDIYTADDADDIVEPDTMFRYGGGQWQLAGGVAEVVSDKSWAELVEETYVEPCGTDSLGYTNEFSMAGTGYPDYFEGDVANLTATMNPSIEGGAYVTARDYGKLLLMHLRGGLCDDTRVLSMEAVAQMQEDRIAAAYDGSTGNPRLEGYGLGWWIDRDNPGVVVDRGAYGSLPWLDTERGYGVFIVMEGSSSEERSLMTEAKPVLDALFDSL